MKPPMPVNFDPLDTSEQYTGEKMRNEIIEAGNIGQITSAFTGYAKFTAGSIHFFQNNHIRAFSGGNSSSHQPRGAAADNHYFFIAHDKPL